jgi:urea transport system substrate-binding protein
MAVHTNNKFVVAIVIPFQGVGGLFGPSCRAVAELAAHEMNQASGILGRHVELVFVDAGREPTVVAEEVGALVRQGAAHAITGWHISPVRDALVEVVRGRIPYVYTALYEGGEARPGVFSSGEVPITQVSPAMKWLGDNADVKDWNIVGHDYVWPRNSAQFVVRIAPSLGMSVRGAAFAPMGDEAAILGLVDKVERESAQGIAMFLVGHDAVVFNREFAARGLDRTMVRYSPMMDENMLLGSGCESTENLYSSAGYFRSLITSDTLDLQGRYSAFHGPLAPALSNTAESCYEGMATLSNLIERAGSADMTAVNAAIVGLAYDGPRGVVEYHGPQGVHHVYLAKADGHDFDIVASL